MLLSPLEVLRYGLAFLKIDRGNKTESYLRVQFHKHYGSSPLDLADQWYDLTVTDIPEAKLSLKENSHHGFKRFMMAHYYLWSYEKNSHMLGSRFDIGERNCRGDPVWKWIAKIGALKAKKIVWPADWSSDDAEIFAITADGVDFRMWEKKHPKYNLDPKQCSKKFNHGAVKYLIAIAVFRRKAVFIDGPYRGGLHDLEMFRQKLKAKIQAARKKCITDRGFRSKLRDEQACLSLPDPMDSKQLGNFKSRARLRHETFNGRIKFFRILSDTFRHGEEKHKLAFEAVVVTVQYQMDNGSPIYDV